MSDKGSGLTIDRLIMILKESYNGVDLRAVIVKSHEKSDCHGWILVFLKMLFTNEMREEIEHSHREVERRVGNIDEENLKVKLIYCEINKVRDIIKCISKGHISISGYLSQIHGDYTKIKTREAINDSGFTDSENLCKMDGGILSLVL